MLVLMAPQVNLCRSFITFENMIQLGKKRRRRSSEFDMPIYMMKLGLIQLESATLPYRNHMCYLGKSFVSIVLSKSPMKENLTKALYIYIYIYICMYIKLQVLISNIDNLNNKNLKSTTLFVYSPPPPLIIKSPFLLTKPKSPPYFWSCVYIIKKKVQNIL